MKFTENVSSRNFRVTPKSEIAINNNITLIIYDIIYCIVIDLVSLVYANVFYVFLFQVSTRCHYISDRSRHTYVNLNDRYARSSDFCESLYNSISRANQSSTFRLSVTERLVGIFLDDSLLGRVPRFLHNRLKKISGGDLREKSRVIELSPLSP